MEASPVLLTCLAVPALPLWHLIANAEQSTPDHTMTQRHTWHSLQVGPQRAGLDTMLGPDHLAAAALGLRSLSAREPDVDSAPAGPTHGAPQVRGWVCVCAGLTQGVGAQMDDVAGELALCTLLKCMFNIWLAS
jgi:hypothetical protein